MPKDDWIFLGEGSYNKVYISEDHTVVLKIQKNSSGTDTPRRSVRLWNAINAHYPPPASIKKSEFGDGWVCPFIQGDQASDEEMANALIDIFNNTGRIVVDATASKNFVTTSEGQVLCVDVGLALQLERREEIHFKDIRRKNFVCLNAWSKLSEAYNRFYKDSSFIYPKTVNIIKALIFIKYNRPDIYDANFLKTNPELVEKLAKAYDRQNRDEALNNLDIAQTQSEPKTFNLRLQKINNTHEEVNNDSSFSKSEKVFINQFCNKLKNIIISESLDKKNENNMESQIDTCLNQMITESNKIPRTSGFLGFINKIFEALGREKPFTITNSEVISKVTKLKSDLQSVKDENPTSDYLKNKENISFYK